MDAKSLAHLEKLGLEAVVAALAKGDGSLATVGGDFHSQAELWVLDKLASAARDAREAEILAIAKSANRLALWANAIAIVAAITAVVAIVIAK